MMPAMSVSANSTVRVMLNSEGMGEGFRSHRPVAMPFNGGLKRTRRASTLGA